MGRHDTRFPTEILIILERDDETKEKQSSQYSGQGVLFLQKIIVAFIHKSQLTRVVAYAWFRGEAAPFLPTPFAKQLQMATVWLHAPTPTGRKWPHSPSNCPTSKVPGSTAAGAAEPDAREQTRSSLDEQLPALLLEEGGEAECREDPRVVQVVVLDPEVVGRLPVPAAHRDPDLAL